MIVLRLSHVISPMCDGSRLRTRRQRREPYVGYLNPVRRTTPRRAQGRRPRDGRDRCVLRRDADTSGITKSNRNVVAAKPPADEKDFRGELFLLVAPSRRCGPGKARRSPPTPTRPHAVTDTFLETLGLRRHDPTPRRFSHDPTFLPPACSGACDSLLMHLTYCTHETKGSLQKCAVFQQASVEPLEVSPSN